MGHCLVFLQLGCWDAEVGEGEDKILGLSLGIFTLKYDIKILGQVKCYHCVNTKGS